MISLRLSADEYDALRALYPTYGARSLSDFARLAMKRIIGGSFAPDDALLLRLNELDQRLSSIEARFAAGRDLKSEFLS
jgi:RAB protein geranylgeranyltransferase component A